MNITFRKAVHQDINEIMQLISAAIINMEQHDIHQWDSVYPTKEEFEEDINKEYLEVGEINSEIVVLYAVNKNYDEQYENGQWRFRNSNFCIIHRLCVNPYYQNQGIARITLENIEKMQKGLGTESIRLDVFSKNPYALALYEKFDYEKVGYADWRKGRFYLMEKRLN